MKILAIVPARGGSKGIPRKNLRPFAGRPLIAWTIQAAVEAGLAPLVSTDSPEIADAATALGARAMLRPAELATDESPVIETIRWHLDREPHCDAVLLLQPTNPLRAAAHITQAIEMLADPRADSVLSVVDLGADAHPARARCAMTIVRFGEPDPSLRVIRPAFSYAECRRQALERVWHRDGSIYLARPELVRAGRLEGPACLPLEIPPERSLRLDTEWDWARGEWMFVVNEGGTYGQATLEAQ